MTRQQLHKQPLAFQLGYGEAACKTNPRYVLYEAGYEPITAAHRIRNGYSHPDLQIPQYIAGAQMYLAEHR